MPACSGRVVAWRHADTGDRMDDHGATDSSRCWRRCTLSKLQTEAEIMKNAISQKNRLYATPENVQEHLSFDTLENTERCPERQGTTGGAYILFATST